MASAAKPKGDSSRSKAAGAKISMKFAVDGERTPGLELVQRLLQSGEADDVELTPEIAGQAIDAFEALTIPWLVEEIIESGEQFAKQVHSVVTRGLQEVVQNADDQGAKNIRFGYRRRASKAELLVAHDGDPVEIIDVMRMALPLLSGSREDPDKIGRFGIGLKTLKQLGDELAVHCPPVPGFEIHKGGRIRRIKRQPTAIRGFWTPSERETLFVLRLARDEFDWPFFRQWLSTWDASSLLFLRSLRSVSLTNLSSSRRGKPARCALEVGRARSVELEMQHAPPAQQVTIKDADGSRKWTRYSIEYPRPKKLQSTNKKVGDTVRLQIAIPNRESENRIYVGLPVEEPSDLPYAFSAPFDPNVERTRLRDNNALNEWLIERVGDLATAISLKRFANDPKSGWSSVPLEGEGAGDSPWVAECLSKMASRQRSLVAKRVSLRLADETIVKLGGLTYEPAEFDGLIDPASLNLLWRRTSAAHGERRAVPHSWRDKGRWRALLSGLDGPQPLWASDCISMLDWPNSELPSDGARWLVAMVSAGLEAEEEEELWGRKCVALAGDRGRLSPAEIEERGTLLVHSLPKDGLAATLDLAQQISRPFTARNATAATVRKWLAGKGVLRERASDHDALRALSRAELDSPIDLRSRNPVLLRLRNSFEQLPAEEREEIGQGIGDNIGLSGYAYEKGGKAPMLVRLSEAYLPSAIDKALGWPTAAGQTPGLQWVDRRYSTLLRTESRGQGALSFLRALGAGTAPRLEPSAKPPSDPHATKLRRKRGLSAQHKEELADLTEATGLRDDWRSPDLDAVVANLTWEKKAGQRRKRAQALFLALDRAWDEVYAQRTTAMSVHHRHTWREDGEVSATWLAKLASEPWLSTQESRFHAAAPRDLTVLTEAAFEIAGSEHAKYVYEIGAKDVDSPVVDALGIEGRPRADSILARLEAMREGEAAGEKVEQGWTDRCYVALSSYAPGGRNADRSDLSKSQLKRAFAKGRKTSGLIRSGGRWLAAGEVRRGRYLDPSLGWVRPDADHLWDLLGVQPSSAADCAAVLTTLAKKAGSEAHSGEINVFRRLLELHEEKRLKKSALRRLPLRLHAAEKRHSSATKYAVSNAVVAEALGRQWPVWSPPLPLSELAPIISMLEVERIEEENLTAHVPGHLVVDSFDLQEDFFAAVGHLEDYLAVHHPALLERLDASRLEELRGTHVVVGGGWGIRVRAGRRRSTLVQVRAHLFRDPLRLCLAHVDEIDAPDAGGEAIANYLVGENEAPEDRSILVLAWGHAYRVRNRARDDISLAAPETEALDAPPASFAEFARKGKRPRAGRKRDEKASAAPPPRELVDVDGLQLEKVEATFLEAKRNTKMKVPAKTKLSPGRAKRNGSNASGNDTHRRTAFAGYTDRDREDVALEIVSAMLERDRGLDLEDIRNQHDAGADAIDRKQDIWVEIKAHGRDVSESLRFPRSEAERARQKRGNYWLVVVWDLEAPRVPKMVVVPDPMHRLDTYLGNGMRLVGLRDLVEKSKIDP